MAITLNNFYKICKIEYINSPNGYTFQTDSDIVFQECCKLILDRNIKIHSYYRFVVVYFKFGYFTIPYFMVYNNMFINNDYNWQHNYKEGDYVFIPDNPMWSLKDINKEFWWNYLGNLKDPDLELIDLITSFINY